MKKKSKKIKKNKKNYFEKFWNGDLSLPISYWLFGFCLFIFNCYFFNNYYSIFWKFGWDTDTTLDIFWAVDVGELLINIRD